MTNAPNIILVGPMGAGKTTIGRLLSQSLKREFFDSDRVIEEKAGADIPWIFDKEGEEGFRRRETNVLYELTQELGESVVMATGGGAVMKEENRRILQQGGLVIYLYATVAQQLSRTSKSNHRPLLQTGNPKETLTRLFQARDPLYKEVADLVVETDTRHPRAVANKVLAAIEQYLSHSSKQWENN